MAGHAGTTPMAVREDALVEAAEFVLHAREAAGIDDAVATVGQVEVEPGGDNVIPGRVAVSVDPAHPTAIGSTGSPPSSRSSRRPATSRPDDGGVRAALRAEIEARGLPALELPSGPATTRACSRRAGVPCGMLFVRSLNGGASHKPDEYELSEDIQLAVDVLAGALARLADEAVVVGRERATASGTSISSPQRRHAALQPRRDQIQRAPRRPADPRARGRGRLVSSSRAS